MRFPWRVTNRVLALASAALAIVIGIVFILVLNHLTRRTATAVVNDFAILFANEVDAEDYPTAFARLEDLTRGTASLSRVRVWVVDEQCRVVMSNDGSEDGMAPPFASIWKDMPKPTTAKEVAFQPRRSQLIASYAIVRLSRPDHFAVIRPADNSPLEHLLTVRIFLILTMLVFAALGSLLVSTLYFRSRSRHARRILSQLAAGDLTARFDIGPLDEAGGLMRDFNRMADEIQRLVGRLRDTEDGRRIALRELGHDLRTPLTSLRAAVETVTRHHDALDQTSRDELTRVIDCEIRYFIKLVEDLLFLTEVGEPRYRSGASEIDILALLRSEAEVGSANQRTVTVSCDGLDACIVQGDATLLTRMFRNAIDNAARYAERSIGIGLGADGTGTQWIIAIRDDGPGLSADDLAAFGKRRTRRTPDSRHPASLGLGSVIITTIAEAHGGRAQMQNRTDAAGAELEIVLPRAKR